VLPAVTPLTVWLSARTADGVAPPFTRLGQDELVHAAVRDGLAGLILERSGRYGLPLPAPVARRLERHATTVAARNLQIQSELERVLRTLEDAKVPVMLLKGAALNLTLYPRPDLRPMSDVDLLVRPEDAERAVAALLEHSWRRGRDLVREGFFPRYHYECELLGGSIAPLRIDLHARPLRPLRLARTMPTDAFWAGAETARVGSSQGMIAARETMFIHLAAHAAFHGCSRLLWLYDIKRFVDELGHTLDWDAVGRRSCEWRLLLALRQAIEAVTDCLGPFCPADVLRCLTGPGCGWRDRLTLWQAPRDAASPLAHVLVNLVCTPGIRYRFGYVTALLCPSPAHLAGLYPYRHRGWVPCAHVWRLVRATGRFVSMPWRLLMRAVHRTDTRWNVLATREIPDS
jgi:hypothetical protein